MAKIKVLQVVGNMNAGGMETLLMNWYRLIDREKIQFEFLVHSEKKGVYEDEILSLGGVVHHLSFRDDLNFFKYLRDLDTFFKMHVSEYALIHGHQTALGFFYLRSAKQHGLKNRIIHSHNASITNNLKGKVAYILQRMVKPQANYWFACSEAAGKYLYGKNAKFRVINNGIDTKKFAFSRAKRDELRKQLAIEDRKVIIHVGRFQIQKNHKLLIEIFKEVYMKDKNTILLLCGAGELRESVEEQVNKYRLTEAVRFLGLRNDIQDLLCAADVFVFPSLYEGLPLTLVEAQASGLPIVCSNTITIETKLTDSYYSHSLEDPAISWAETILCAENKDREKNYIEIESKGYNSHDVVEEIAKIYLDISKNN